MIHKNRKTVAKKKLRKQVKTVQTRLLIKKIAIKEDLRPPPQSKLLSPKGAQ